MNSQFDYGLLKVIKMSNRIGDLEESISLMRNLNLDLMVTPERLEDKMHLVQ